MALRLTALAMQDAIPAATVIVFRDSEGAAPPDLLMVERAKAMVFAGGALVFPGGRIDPGDHALAATCEDAPADAAARIAAIRETIEEAGVPIGLSILPDEPGLARLRQGLHAGEPFGRLLRDAGVTLDLLALAPFARWRPAHAHMRIFDTHFYLASLPRGAPNPVVDATENVRVFWASARRVLDDADAGRATIIFPTRRNLERLAQFANFADAVADARAHPIRAVTPWTEDREGVPHLCIDTDLGYPVTAEVLTNTTRG
jgi:8-oxo-dGTP pyrophosphatase MutT (NUDIX family)